MLPELKNWRNGLSSWRLPIGESDVISEVIWSMYVQGDGSGERTGPETGGLSSAECSTVSAADL